AKNSFSQHRGSSLLFVGETTSYQTTNNLLFLLLKFIQVCGFGFECISVIEFMACIGSALTAGHF
ncbi:hypothetical protein, partial [Pseudomonas kitaguniensis]|uniref:hypothetical protein n=1 Tax=Pseudomonas kitaguniensis TaxID=2607908 RepID=UPI0019D55F7D